jgi:hypothetical protein
MKKSIFVPLLLVALIAMNACSKDDNGNPDQATPPAGQWRISYYWDEKDETSDFSGYTFEFLTGGTLKATMAGITVNGTWSETSAKLVIDFGADPVLSEINDDWQKTEKTSTSIKLKDDNPAQDDQLHFVKL